MAGNGRTPGRSVTSKVAAILDAFTPGTADLTLNELARRADLPLSTTYRLATELVAWGGLARGPAGGYRIGLRLWEVGTAATRATKLRDVVRPFMRDLHDATSESVSLVVVDGLEALRLEQVSGPTADPPTSSSRAIRLPLHATAAGKALLAFAPEDLVETIVEGGLRRYTEHTLVVPGILMRSLTRIRKTGISIAREEMTTGSLAVASPVLDPQGRAAAALSISIGRRRTQLRRLTLAVRTAAVGATREFCVRRAGRPRRHHPDRRPTGCPHRVRRVLPGEIGLSPEHPVAVSNPRRPGARHCHGQGAARIFAIEHGRRLRRSRTEAIHAVHAGVGRSLASRARRDPAQRAGLVSVGVAPRRLLPGSTTVRTGWTSDRRHRDAGT
jgi:DNA-binding IclR family transcriptional regulator